MASNTRTLRDENGLYDDWIEIQNTTDQPINLGGWYLTDTRRNLREWSFPATNLNAGAYLYVFASSFRPEGAWQAAAHEFQAQRRR